MHSIQVYLDIYKKLMAKHKLRYNEHLSVIIRSNLDSKTKNIKLSLLNRNYRNAVYKLKYKIYHKVKATIKYQKEATKYVRSNLPLNFTSKKSLLIGINYYGTKYELNGCINDVKNMASRLAQNGFANKLLLDDNSYKPTLNNILNQFISFLSSAKPGDLLFFLFSGHGHFIRDKNGDEADGRDEVIITSDLNIIKDDVLKKIVHRYLRPGVTLVALFDSCYSGTIMDLKYKYLDSLNYNRNSIDNRQRDTPGNILCLSSSLDSEVSIDSNLGSKYGGAMTTALLSVLQTNERINWRTLIQRTRDQLRATGNLVQTPQISSGRANSIDTPVFI